MNILETVEGFKTYIAAAIGIVVAGLLATGYIDQMQFEIIVAFLTPIGFITLRHGISTTMLKASQVVAGQPEAPTEAVEPVAPASEPTDKAS